MPYKDREKKLAYDRQYKEDRKMRGYCACGAQKEDRRRKWCYSCKPPYDATRYESDKAYRANHPEVVKTCARKYNNKLRHEVIMAYGGYQCACPGCGVTEPKFLGIDHIEGGGNEHRKKVGNSNINSWLKKNGFPPGFQVLCHNCNLAKGFYGKCPHQDVIESRLNMADTSPVVVGKLERRRATASCCAAGAVDNTLMVTQ